MPKSGYRSQFRGEMRKVSSLPPHPFIVQIYGVCVELPAIVMEFVPYTLQGLLAEHRLTELEKARVANELSSGLVLAYY